MKDSANYYTTGELAQIVNIPRKTLLYYDKLGIIKPQLVDDNGYRYYIRTQISQLELIISLRKLGIPLAQIQEYQNSRSLEIYSNLLKECIVIAKKQLLTLEKTCLEIEASLSTLQEIEHLEITDLETPQIIETAEEYYLLSESIPAKASFKVRSNIYSKLFVNYSQDTYLNSHVYGTLLDQLSLAEDCLKLKNYFIPLFEKTDAPNIFTRPQGQYLRYYFKGVLQKFYKYHFKKIEEYCQKEGIVPISDLYITSLKNYWTCENTNDYLYKIEFAIKKDGE